MSRARDRADGQDLTAYAPLASPDFTGTVDLTGTTVQLDDDEISLDKVSGGTLGAGALGSSVVFPDGAVVKHEQVSTVISAEQSLTQNYADITGSSITYTPATGASYIVYECSFVVSAASEADPLFAFRFMFDGSITKNQDSYAPSWDNLALDWNSPRQGHKMIYSASGWTSGKVVKMQAREYKGTGAGDREVQLHHNHFDYLTADGSALGTTDRLTDVITTIYSVM